MGYVRDQWFKTQKDESGKPVKAMTTKHPEHPDNADPKVKKRKKEAKRYLALWEGPDGKVESKAFAKKSDAESHQKSQEVAVSQGTYFDAAKGAVKLRTYAIERWLPNRIGLRDSSRELYNQHLKTHIIPILGNIEIGSLDREAVQSFVKRISESLAPTTVEVVYNVLRALMTTAFKAELIRRNPCSEIELPEIERTLVVPTADVVVALANAVPSRYRLAVFLASMIGTRLGETMGLTKDNIRGIKGHSFAHIVQQAQGKELTTKLKSKDSKRVIPIDDMLFDEINRHLSTYDAGPNGLIITNRLGNIVQRSSFGHCWRDAVEKSGVPVGTRFHDLRHFYASSLIASNKLSPKAIQARMGHASIQETFDTYGHLFPEDNDLGRGVMGAALQGAFQDHEADTKLAAV